MSAWPSSSELPRRPHSLRLSALPSSLPEDRQSDDSAEVPTTVYHVSTTTRINAKRWPCNGCLNLALCITNSSKWFDAGKRMRLLKDNPNSLKSQRLPLKIA